MLNRKCVSLVLLLFFCVVRICIIHFCMAQMVQAQPVQPGLSLQVVHEYNDNVLLTKNKIQNQSDSLLVDVNIDQRTNSYQTLVVLSAEHESNSAIEDRDVVEGTAQLDVSLLPERLSWTFQDILSQVRIDPLTPLTPTNAVNTQNLSTGPDWRWQITAADLMITQLRTERVLYQDGDFIDRDRLKSSVEWRHQLNRLWQSGLGYHWIDEKFDNQSNVELNTLTGLLERNSSLTQLALTLGKTQVQSLGTSETVGSLQWRYRLNSVWDLVASAQRSVSSDIDTQQRNSALLTTTSNTIAQSTTNFGEIFNANNVLSIDQGASFSSEWLWAQRQLSLTVNRRMSRRLLDGQPSLNSIDEFQTDQQSVRLYNPINPRWWWVLQLTLQQTNSDKASSANVSELQKLDEQLVMTEIGYRINPDVSLTQNILFQHYDESLPLSAGLSKIDADGFRYLIGLTWAL